MRIGQATNFDELLAACEEAQKRRAELRRGFETQWWNNLAMLAGDHYAEWDPYRGEFRERPKEPHKTRLALNHTLISTRTEYARITKSRPVLEVMPKSNEPTDIAAAKVGRSVLEGMEWQHKLTHKRKQALWWCVSTGLGAIYVGFDQDNAEAGEREFWIDPQTNSYTFNRERISELRQELETGNLSKDPRETIPLGDLAYKVYSPFQLYPDETALSFHEINDLITVDAVDVDIAKGMWGVELNPEDTQLGAMEKRMISRAGFGLTRLQQSTVDGAVNIYTFWLLPNVYRSNRFLKNGVMIRWANHKIIERSSIFPYRDNRIPYAFYEHIPNDTSIWPDCIVTHIRNPNLEMDKKMSQLIENADYMANPLWRHATQHQIKGKIKNIAGGEVKYVHVPNIPPPEPIPGQPMPAQVENLVVGLRDQILEISGQSEPSRGKVPSGVRSGVAVAYLQEEDETKIGPTIENYELGIAVEGSLALARVGQFFTTERTLRYYRRDGVFDVIRFRGADLRGNSDVICQAGSALPRMKAAKQQFVLELVSMGLLTDQKKIMDMLEIGEGEPDDIDKAILQADRENQMMLRGGLQMPTGEMIDAKGQPMIDPQTGQPMKGPVALPVKQWHNHAVHMMRHTSMMMDAEFDQMALTHPDIVRLFDEHITKHQEFLEAEQQRQMMLANATRGGEAGTAPTPTPGQSVPDTMNGQPEFDQAAV